MNRKNYYEDLAVAWLQENAEIEKMKYPKNSYPLRLFKQRRNEDSFPEWKLDETDRFVVADAERCPCCDGFRPPSTLSPDSQLYLLLAHCRLLKHCRSLFEKYKRAEPVPDDALEVFAVSTFTLSNGVTGKVHAVTGVINFDRPPRTAEEKEASIIDSMRLDLRSPYGNRSWWQVTHAWPGMPPEIMDGDKLESYIEYV